MIRSQSIPCLASFLLVAAALCQADTRSSIPELSADFGIRLFREVAASVGDRNVVLSPYGATALIGMAQLGAAGNTLEQLWNAMGYRLKDKGVPLALKHLQKDLTAKSNRDIVYSASSVFVQRNMQLQNAYLKSYRRAFNGWPKQIYFHDANTATYLINKWVEVQTRGMIPKFLRPGMLDPVLTRMVLINAVYFKGLWKMPFPAKATHQRVFYKEDGTKILVPMMSQSAKLNASEFVTPSGLDYDVIELPYHGETLSMYIVAPFRKEVPLSALTDIITVSLVDEWTRSLETVKRQLVLPKFSLDSEVDLRKSLTAMGITDIFNARKADLSKISTSEQLFVAKALQKVKIEVNESGTKASAATAAVLYERMAPFEVVIDRPFLFLVRHNPTGTILFMGQVMEP
ncbi:plasminogen activator inhibitor 1 [Stegostoma tigrinum]|uniref:plasminogen activator inhibitor 1 n=1 Tax=Stegostoma tigrinum TaxID=3053191 RepID=UPI00202B1D8F|nr:plasminogen activator inhibitor 1 [Stegostoma tigrinum]XP_048380366.1 plasminogen activator inhibitor 1 [Stegostoma tigrinum]